MVATLPTLELIVWVRSCMLVLVLLVHVFRFLLKRLGCTLQAIRVVRLPRGRRARRTPQITLTINITYLLLYILLRIILVLLLLQIRTAHATIIRSRWCRQYRRRLVVVILLAFRGTSLFVALQLFFVYFLDKHLLIGCHMLLRIRIILRGIGLLLAQLLQIALATALITFVRDHVLWGGMHHTSHLLILLILRICLNGTQTIGTLWWSSWTFEWRLAFLLWVLRIICLKFLGAFGLAAMLKVAIILIIQRLQFPGSVLSSISNILIFYMWLLKVL
jgi:hypothetical protein